MGHNIPSCTSKKASRLIGGRIIERSIKTVAVADVTTVAVLLGITLGLIDGLKFNTRMQISRVRC